MVSVSLFLLMINRNNDRQAVGPIWPRTWLAPREVQLGSNEPGVWSAVGEILMRLKPKGAGGGIEFCPGAV